MTSLEGIMEDLGNTFTEQSNDLLSLGKNDIADPSVTRQLSKLKRQDKQSMRRFVKREKKKI